MFSTQSSSTQKPLLMVFPFGLLSHYLRCLVLCRHLSAFYEIRFQDNPRFHDFIREEGFETFSCEGLDPIQAIESVKRFDMSWLNREKMEPIFLQQIAVINMLKPAAVLGDYSPTLKMAADKTRIRFISVVNGYMTQYYASTRKISRNHPAAPLIASVPSFFGDWLTRFGENKAFKKMARPFAAIRQQYQLAANHSYMSELEGDINLVCDLPQIFPQRSLPPNYHIIGPLFYNAGPRAIKHLFAFDKSKKTILVSMGSSGNWIQLRYLNDDAFKRYNILAVGDSNHILRGDHIQHIPFANMHDLFPHVNLMICHGGNGTMYQGLYYAVPILVSTNHCEQEWNLAAFESWDAAASLDQLTSPGEVIQMIESRIGAGTGRNITMVSDAVKTMEKELPGVLHKIFAGTSVVKKITTAQHV